MGHPQVVAALLSLTLVVSGCANLRWSVQRSLREPGERIETFPELVWEDLPLHTSWKRDNAEMLLRFFQQRARPQQLDLEAHPLLRGGFIEAAPGELEAAPLLSALMDNANISPQQKHSRSALIPVELMIAFIERS